MRPAMLYAAAFALMPCLGMADVLKVENAVVPLAPPTAMAHAAYMSLTSTSEAPIEVVGVTAKGYGMAHLHRSTDTDGVATMSAVDAITLKPGQHVMFEPGGLHIMLMHPERALTEGDTVAISLIFSDGGTQAVEALVVPRGKVRAMTHKHGS